MTFNPKQHITNMRGKDYLEVKWRLVWFRDEHPTGRIETEVIQHEPVLMKATVYTEDKCLATGYGTAKMQGVAKSRPYEGAETAAIGRALAHAGFGTQFTGEDEGDNLADNPVEPTPKAQPEPSGKMVRPMNAMQTKSAILGKAKKYETQNRTVTDKQDKMFSAIWLSLFDDQKDRYAVTEWLFNITSSNDITDSQKLALIDWLSLEKDDNNHFVPSNDAIRERSNMVSAVMKEQGQLEFAA